MPRSAREKGTECIYHVMCRSVSEFNLFRDNDDREYYLNLLSRYKKRYMCKIYAYCLMNTHMHLHFDPQGADISKFMHSTNTAYVRYYNKKYNRHGHVFQERFQSKILKDEKYNVAVSAYIHNNAKDIEGYAGKEQEYKYSSYGIYIGIQKDLHKLIDMSLMQNLFGLEEKEFRKNYFELVKQQRDIGCLKKSVEEIKIKNKNEYRSEREIIKRDAIPSSIIAYISEKVIINIDENENTYTKKKEYREFCSYILRTLCGLKYREICGLLYNITLSGCSIMCDRGYNLIERKVKYKKILDELVQYNVVI